MSTKISKQSDLQFIEDQGFLERRGILPDPEREYSTHQLAFELSRRGWRWRFDPERAEATKANTPSRTEPATFVAHDGDTITNLARVLVDAIRFDEEHGLTPTNLYRPDIIVQSSAGLPVALVEVRNPQGLTHDAATAWRRNMLLHGPLTMSAPYFLLVSQETGYLWDQRHDSSPAAPPTASFPMHHVVERYARWLTPGDRLRGTELEIIVLDWLSGLTDVDGIQPGSPEEALVGTGFLDSIRHGQVHSELAP